MTEKSKEVIHKLKKNPVDPCSQFCGLINNLAEPFGLKYFRKSEKTC